jgi:hypothetical protein
VDNIRMDLGEVGWGDVDWIGLALDRNRWRALMNSILNLRVLWNAGKLWSGLTSSGLSSTLVTRCINRDIACSLERAVLSPSCRRSVNYLITPVKSRLLIREVKDVIKTPHVQRYLLLWPWISVYEETSSRFLVWGPDVPGAFSINSYSPSPELRTGL